MKKVLSLILVGVAMVLTASEIDVANFEKATPNGLPYGWYLNRWIGYQPKPEFKVDKPNVIHVYNIKGKYGFGFASTYRFLATSGEIFTVKAKVKGSGNVQFALQLFTEENKFIKAAEQTLIELTPQWQEITLDLKVEDIKDKTVGKAMLAVGATNGSDLFIKDLKLNSQDK